MEFVTPRCPECGAPLPACMPGDSVTCAYCGSTLVAAGSAIPTADPVPPKSKRARPVAAPAAPLLCRDCGRENQAHYRFCLGCGGALT